MSGETQVQHRFVWQCSELRQVRTFSCRMFSKVLCFKEPPFLRRCISRLRSDASRFGPHLDVLLKPESWLLRWLLLFSPWTKSICQCKSPSYSCWQSYRSRQISHRLLVLSIRFLICFGKRKNNPKTLQPWALFSKFRTLGKEGRSWGHSCLEGEAGGTRNHTATGLVGKSCEYTHLACCWSLYSL
jgi:hypothetical protein